MAFLETPVESGRELLDFSVDINPMGLPKSLASLLWQIQEEIGRYPEPTYEEFRRSVARWEGIETSMVLPGNGTADLIHLLTRLHAVHHCQRRNSQGSSPHASGEGNFSVAILVPTFTEYERAALSDGATIRTFRLHLEGDRFFPPQLPGILCQTAGKATGEGLGDEKIQLVFLCNPNNPTGTLWPKGELLRWVTACEASRIRIVVDEAYMDLVEDRLRYSAVPWVKEFEHLIVLRSMTKAFAVPGLRIGYLVASPETVGELSSIQPPWSMNAMAAAAGSALVKEIAYLEDSRRMIQQARQDLWEALKGAPGLIPYVSSANFILCRMANPDGSNQAWPGQNQALLKSNRTWAGSNQALLGSNSAWPVPNRILAERLRSRGILIRTCDDFTGLAPGRFIRIAVKRPQENQILVETLKEVFFHAG